jgi:hypothetical protein
MALYKDILEEFEKVYESDWSKLRNSHSFYLRKNNVKIKLRYNNSDTSIYKIEIESFKNTHLIKEINTLLTPFQVVQYIVKHLYSLNKISKFELYYNEETI